MTPLVRVLRAPLAPLLLATLCLALPLVVACHHEDADASASSGGAASASSSTAPATATTGTAGPPAPGHHGIAGAGDEGIPSGHTGPRSVAPPDWSEHRMAPAVGQWAKYALKDGHGSGGTLVYKIVGRQGDNYWLEVDTERRGHSSKAKMLVNLGADPTDMRVSDAWLDMNGRPMHLAGPMLAESNKMLDGFLHGVSGSMHSDTQEDVTVPAGTFRGRFRKGADVTVGGMHAHSTLWRHPAVPILALVRFEVGPRPVRGARPLRHRGGPDVLPVMSARDRQDGSTLPRLVEVMQRLLAPDGCPWNWEQTLESLRPYVIEEAFEVVDAIDQGQPEALREELGDLLLQVVFQASSPAPRSGSPSTTWSPPCATSSSGATPTSSRRPAAPRTPTAPLRAGRSARPRRRRTGAPSTAYRSRCRPCSGRHALERRHRASATTGPTPPGRARRSTRGFAEMDAALEAGDTVEAEREARRPALRHRELRAQAWLRSGGGPPQHPRPLQRPLPPCRDRRPQGRSHPARHGARGARRPVARGQGRRAETVGSGPSSKPREPTGSREGAGVHSAPEAEPVMCSGKGGASQCQRGPRRHPMHNGPRCGSRVREPCSFCSHRCRRCSRWPAPIRRSCTDASSGRPPSRSAPTRASGSRGATSTRRRPSSRPSCITCRRWATPRSARSSSTTSSPCAPPGVSPATIVLLVGVVLSEHTRPEWDTRPETVCTPAGCFDANHTYVYDIPVIEGRLTLTAYDGPTAQVLSRVPVRASDEGSDYQRLRSHVLEALTAGALRLLDPRIERVDVDLLPVDVRGVHEAIAAIARGDWHGGRMRLERAARSPEVASLPKANRARVYYDLGQARRFDPTTMATSHATSRRPNGPCGRRPAARPANGVPARPARPARPSPRARGASGPPPRGAAQLPRARRACGHPACAARLRALRRVTGVRRGWPPRRRCRRRRARA